MTDYYNNKTIRNILQWLICYVKNQNDKTLKTVFNSLHSELCVWWLWTLYETELGDFLLGSVEMPSLNSSGECDFCSSDIFQLEDE